MTNVIMLVMIVTNFALSYDVVGTRQKECPEGRIGCTVYHGESIYSKTGYTETRTTMSNTYVVTTINDVSYSNLTASVEVEKLSRSVKEVKSSQTSEWTKVIEPKNWLLNTNCPTNQLFIYGITNVYYGTAITTCGEDN